MSRGCEGCIFPHGDIPFMKQSKPLERISIHDNDDGGVKETELFLLKTRN